MSLLLSIIEFPENCTVAESSKTFGEQGGTIGRGADNYWVLSDPDCFLSAKHSEITFENGHYVLTDISTNGTFLNGSREPMGKGNKVQLQNGDEIELSDYKFKIKLWNESTQSVSPLNDDPFANPDVNMGAGTSSGFHTNDPFATDELLPIDSLLHSNPQNVDPLEVLNAHENSSSSTLAMDTYSSDFNQSEHSDILAQSVIWPNSHIDESVIPEDWDSAEDELALMTQAPVQSTNNTMVDANTIQSLRAENARLKKSMQSVKALENKNLKLEKELKKIKRQFLTYQKNNKASQIASVDTTMISSLGLPVKNLTKEQVYAINKTVGKMVRETVAGMMQILTSRNSIKNEFRMNITTIQPVENNPLKFSASLDDALENMFLKSGSSYKKPIEAIVDGFDGIAEHQVAILAGIRAAFKGAIDRFEPHVLEKRFKRQSKNILDFLPLVKKSKNWNQFIHYFNDLTGDMDNSFQYLFGDEFVQAYENQLQKLLIERKSKSK